MPDARDDEYERRVAQLALDRARIMGGRLRGARFADASVDVAWLIQRFTGCDAESAAYLAKLPADVLDKILPTAAAVAVRERMPAPYQATPNELVRQTMEQAGQTIPAGVLR